MTPDELVRKSAAEAIRFLEKSQNLGREIQRQIIYKNGNDAPLIYLLASARSEAVDALQELAKVEPTAVDEIRKLQNKVEMYSSMAYWIANAVASGEQAAKMLEADALEDFERTFIPGDDE